MTTAPDTAEAARTAQLAVELDATYPAFRWWAKVGDEGDFAGPTFAPIQALSSVRYTHSNYHDLLHAGHITIGLWTDELLSLQLQHRMVGAGLRVEAAEQLVADYADALSDAYIAANNQDLKLGFTVVYTVTADGALEILA